MSTIALLALGGQKELQEIKQKLSKHDITLTTKPLSQVEFFISNTNISVLVDGLDILGYDFVWIKSSWPARQIAYAVSLLLQFRAIPHNFVESESSKLVDTLALALCDVPIPKTYFCASKHILKNYMQITDFCGEPTIIKTSRGSLGSGVFLAANEKEFQIVSTKLDARNYYICQEYIPNDSDFRVITSGEKILSVIERIRTSESFRNNTYLGAEEKAMVVKSAPRALQDIALEASNALSLEWSGVDVVKSSTTGKYYILEVNRRPGLTSKSEEVRAAFDHVVRLLEEEGLIS